MGPSPWRKTVRSWGVTISTVGARRRRSMLESAEHAERANEAARRATIAKRVRIIDAHIEETGPHVEPYSLARTRYDGRVFASGSPALVRAAAFLGGGEEDGAGSHVPDPELATHQGSVPAPE